MSESHLYFFGRFLSRAASTILTVNCIIPIAVVLMSVFIFVKSSYCAYPYASKCPSGDKPYKLGPDTSIPGGPIAGGYWHEEGDKLYHYQSLDFWVDQLGFAQCNCTSYVAYRLNEVAPIGFNNNYKESTWGNVGKWDTAADQAHIPRSAQPFPGDVAYWDTESASAASNGHVAFVEKVDYDENGKVIKTYISEYNGRKAYDYTARSFTPSDMGWLDKPTGYIHFLSHEYSQLICASHRNGKELCWSVGYGDMNCQSGVAHFYNDKTEGACLSAGQNDCFGISGANKIVVGGRSGGVPSVISGPGTQLPATEISLPGLPDFTETSLKLMDSDGGERYSYYLFDKKIEMHHWSTNIGEADWAGTAESIKVRFYLSKGYNAGASANNRVRIGTKNIKMGSLNVGDTKHDWMTLDLHEYFSNGYLQDDHVYNIVVCIDRLNDTNNGAGEVAEMHESNNCTSEAVFIFKESALPGKAPRADRSI
jgi:surface antigen